MSVGNRGGVPSQKKNNNPNLNKYVQRKYRQQFRNDGIRCKRRCTRGI